MPADHSQIPYSGICFVSRVAERLRNKSIGQIFTFNIDNSLSIDQVLSCTRDREEMGGLRDPSSSERRVHLVARTDTVVILQHLACSLLEPAPNTAAMLKTL